VAQVSYHAMLAIGFCGLFLPWAAGQPPREPNTNLGAPGEEHRKLDPLAGAWDVVVKFPVGPGKVMEGKSSCEARWVLDGRFLRQEYSSTFAGKPLTVVRYLGFDRHKGKFVEVHFESTHTDVMHSEGVLSADGKAITSWGTHIDAATGKEVKVGTVTTILDQDAFTLEMLYVAGEETKAVTLTHKRKQTRW